jgi:5-methylcytosine-specific restriction endonuclease McrBC regulatory subunit McrC
MEKHEAPAAFDLMRAALNERQWRLYLAVEAKKLGRGGISQVALENSSLSQDMGSFEFRCFLVDMNKFFEEFITKILRDRTPNRVHIKVQATRYLGFDRQVRMRPDIIVVEGKTPILVADCKYKALRLTQYSQHDNYQVLAYCTAARV